MKNFIFGQYRKISVKDKAANRGSALVFCEVVEGQLCILVVLKNSQKGIFAENDKHGNDAKQNSRQ